jgi:hypothetical protein
MAYTPEQIGQAWQAYDAAVARGDTDTAFAVRKQIQTMQPQQNTATSRIDKAWQMYGDAVSKGDFDRALVLRKQIQAMQVSGTPQQRYAPVPLQQAAPQRDVLAQAQRAVRMGQLSKEDYNRIVLEQRGLGQTQKQAAQAFTPALEPSQFAPPPLPVAAPQPVAAPPQRSAPGRYTAEGPGVFKEEYAAQTYPQGDQFQRSALGNMDDALARGAITQEEYDRVVSLPEFSGSGAGVFEDAAAFETIDTTPPVQPQTPEQTLAGAMPPQTPATSAGVASGGFNENLANALNTSAPPTTPGTSQDVGATQQTSGIADINFQPVDPGDIGVEPGLKGWQLREKFKALPIEEQEAKKQLAKQAALPAALGILQAGLEFMPTAQEKEAERLRNIDPAKKARLEQKRFLDATAGGAGEPEYFDQLAKANMALGNTGARGFTQAARIAGQHAAQKDAQKYDAASRVYEQTYAGAEAQRRQALFDMQTTGEKRKEAVMGLLSGEGPFAQALGMLSASKGVRIDESALAKLDPETKKLFFETYKDNPEAAIQILEALTSGQSQEQSETA